MTRKLNNAHLRDIADTVDPSGTTDGKMLNNEYLERIANGIGSITGIVDPSTGKIDSSMLEGVIDASNLPSYVDDVIEGYYHQGAFYSDSAHANAITGETGKIYVDVPSGATYRWGGSAYAKVGGPDVEIATTQDAVTGTNNTKVMTPLKTKQAIDASGVPEMSTDVRGGAKLDADGGLALRDGALGVGSLVQESEGAVRGGIASLTAKGHAEQASTTGKNLTGGTLEQLKSWNTSGTWVGNVYTLYGVTHTVNADGSITVNGTPSYAVTFVLTPWTDGYLADNTQYTLSGCPEGGSSSQTSGYGIYVNNYASVDGTNQYEVDGGSGKTFTTVTNSRIVCRIFIMATVSNLTFHPQLELGSTATEYEPYTGGAPSPSPDYPQEIITVTGHAITGKTGRYVDLEVRQGSTLLSTTPIPLPSRGWVGSLPDGTADVLRLDGAGKVEWELGTWENVINASTSTTSDSIGGQGRATFVISPDCVKFTGSNSNIDNGVMSDHLRASSNVNTYGGAVGIHRRISGSTNEVVLGFGVGRFSTLAKAKTWLATHPVTVLYPLATPVTEQCGYIDMPSIPGDATVTIRELDDLGIKYFVDDSVVEYGRQIYERVRNEYAGRIEQLESAVAELATV